MGIGMSHMIFAMSCLVIVLRSGTSFLDVPLLFIYLGTLL